VNVAGLGSAGKSLVMGWAKKLDHLIAAQAVKSAARHEIVHHAQPRRPHGFVFDVFMIPPGLRVKLLVMDEIGD
jgi:hypothetical protein